MPGKMNISVVLCARQSSSLLTIKLLVSGQRSGRRARMWSWIKPCNFFHSATTNLSTISPNDYTCHSLRKNDNDKNEFAMHSKHGGRFARFDTTCHDACGPCWKSMPVHLRRGLYSALAKLVECILRRGRKRKGTDSESMCGGAAESEGTHVQQ